MFNVHIYDFKEKLPYVTSLRDPFNAPVLKGRFEAYDTAGNLIVSSGRRRIKNLANYTDDRNFVPLQILRVQHNNTGLRITNIKPVQKSKYTGHCIITIA